MEETKYFSCANPFPAKAVESNKVNKYNRNIQELGHNDPYVTFTDFGLGPKICKVKIFVIVRF